MESDATSPSVEKKDSRALPEALLAWYDRHQRRLPWRAPPGKRAEPYHVWLSEIMLQQTTVATVGPYFRRFLERWPGVTQLATAEQQEVLVEWAGLGYYARARNLHRCAQVVAREHGGRFPDSEEELKRLPGIGDYTAAAIAAIAFDRPAAVMDGNIERVVARLYSVEEPLPGVKPKLRGLVEQLTPQKRPGDYAQAMMDLGASLCQPARPKCFACPIAAFCEGRALGVAPELPRKAPRKAKPTRKGVAFWLEDAKGRVLLRRRPEKGLLGGMTEIPSTDWTEDGPEEARAALAAPYPAEWRGLPGKVRHTFTHFHLELEVWSARLKESPEVEGAHWCALDELGGQALPTVMRKVVKQALAEGRLL
jgi:A/G-specific adenine glycosylase